MRALQSAHRPNGAGYNTLGDRKGRPYAQKSKPLLIFLSNVR